MTTAIPRIGSQPPVGSANLSKIKWEEILGKAVGTPSRFNTHLLDREDVLAEILPLEFLDQLAETRGDKITGTSAAYLAHPSIYTLTSDDRIDLHFELAVIRDNINLGRYKISVDKEGVYVAEYYGFHPLHTTKGRVGLRIQRKTSGEPGTQESLVRTDTWNKVTPSVKFFDTPNYTPRKDLKEYIKRV